MSFTMKTAAAIIACGAFTSVGAHMVITNPVPFDKDALNNSPLAADGSDFPCKFGGSTGYTSTVSSMNTLSVGETTNLTFMGSATHGGGSCQISITTDSVPTKDSIWKTIYSIEGGCPTSEPGNIGDSASYTGAGLNSFPFSLPKSIPSGKVTLAWTWNNRVGNRELYMNCAPVTVEGGASDMSAFNKLPDMEVYNIAIGGNQACTIPEGTNVAYQNPGSSTTHAGTAPATAATCKPNVAGSGSASTPEAGGDSSATSTAAAATATASNPGGVFSPEQSGDSASQAASATDSPAASIAAPTTLATSAAPAASTPAAAPASSGSGSCQAGWQPCSTEGVSCLSSTQMINCANGCGYVTDLSSTGMACEGAAGSVHMGYAVAAGAAHKREMSTVARRMPLHARRYAPL